MPVSEHNVQTLKRVLCAKAQGIERRTRLDLLTRTWNTSKKSEEDDKEIPLPNPEISVVHSFHYGQHDRHDWEDELPPETNRQPPHAPVQPPSKSGGISAR